MATCAYIAIHLSASSEMSGAVRIFLCGSGGTTCVRYSYWPQSVSDMGIALSKKGESPRRHRTVQIEITHTS